MKKRVKVVCDLGERNKARKKCLPEMTREKTNQQDMRRERFDNFHANRQHARLSGTRITQ